MSTIQVGQSKELFGINTDSFLFLELASKNKPEIKRDLENFKKSIEVFNSVGIEIDLSIKGDFVLFQERAK